jgi:hypothetical protein
MSLLLLKKRERETMGLENVLQSTDTREREKKKIGLIRSKDQHIRKMLSKVCRPRKHHQKFEPLPRKHSVTFCSSFRHPPSVLLA